MPTCAVGEVSRVVPARRDALGTGQRAHVEDDVSLEVSVGVDHAVRHDQPTLGVSVVDLDCPGTIKKNSA